METIWKGFSNPAVTPPDKVTHLKLLHRALNFKNHKDSRYTDDVCRLCRKHKESELHCTHCPALHKTWKKLAEIFTEGDDPVLRVNHEFTIFGLNNKGDRLRPIHSALHKLVWKFIWIDINKETLGHGTPNTHTLLERATKRLEKTS